MAVSGVPGNDQLYYMGSTGGGLWKTTDAGIRWENISDGYFKTGTVGDIAVADSDPNVIYVGMGEHAVRGVMTSFGDGVYKSTDAGRTWKHMPGLENTRHISDVIIHPTNPDVVYVAAQGAVHGPSADRGIYKSTDGGQTWRKTLFVDENSGASGLSMDKTNPRILYAATWEHRRYPWTVSSGGPGSGLWKSSDSGETWEKLEEGLPDLMGKIGVSVSPANPDRVFAVIEAEGDKAGIYRSDNGGKNWTQTSKDRMAITRSWYYMEIFADPVDPNRVYVLNAPALVSINGGASFRPLPIQHGDTHDLWINPDNPKNMILGDDGGAEISFNEGNSWSSIRNQPTVQFYRVNVDHQFPYNVYGGQQDNSSVVIASRTSGAGIGEKDWFAGPGCESAYIAFDPDNPTELYGGCYQGIIEKLDLATMTSKGIMAYPRIGLGTVPKEMKYRFNWNAPLFASVHDPSSIYHAGNKLLKTTDKGQSWTEVSPDLTRNDSTKQGPGGIPFTNEGAGGENYNTIMYVAESPHAKGTIWVGSDDGLLHLTTNDGGDWTNVTPPDMGETMINSIEVSPHDDNTVYVVATRYKFNDMSPAIYKTKDKGVSWTRINSGIAAESFARVVREDKKVPGLLYAGTEKGLYVSFDEGTQWHDLQLNLPIVPITDMILHDNDLIAATQGRGFWILDDAGAIQQSKGKFEGQVQLFEPKPTVRTSGFSVPIPPPNLGENPKYGVVLDYWLKQELDTIPLTMEILENGEVIRTLTNQFDESYFQYPGGPPPGKPLPSKAGLNRFAWDLRRATIPHVPTLFVLGDYRGHRVAPGDYSARMILQNDTVSVDFQVVKDPRLEATATEFAEQQKLLTEIREAVSSIHTSVVEMREGRRQILSIRELLKESDQADTLINYGTELYNSMKSWEENLVQPKQKTFQDVINFPNELNAELLSLSGNIDTHDPMPTQGSYDRFNDLMAEWKEHKAAMNDLLKGVDEYNALYKELGLPAVIMNLKE